MAFNPTVGDPQGTGQGGIGEQQGTGPGGTTDEEASEGYFNSLFRKNMTKFGILLITIGVSLGVGATRKDKVLQFSNHAFENQNHHSITGPFLSKVRFRPNNSSIKFKGGYEPKYQQSACQFNSSGYYMNKEKIIKDVIQDKCKIMRIPTLYLGDVHSSWSVLGAQSNYNLCKHIGCIVIVFFLYAFIEELIYVRLDARANSKETYDTFRHHHHFMRSALLMIAIIIFGVDLAFDIKNDNLSSVADNKSTYAIGSITTGFSFCVVTLMIMCFTYMQEPYERDKPLKSTNITEQSGSQIQEKKDEENGTNGGNSVLDDRASIVQGNGSRFQIRSLNFGPFEYPHYTYGKPGEKYIPTHIEQSSAYTRLCDIYFNIHTSYLMLLIFPLVWIVALNGTGKVIVDVHIQLIFFSVIFVAFLDICQALVMSVLQTFDATHTLLNKHPIGLVKTFVVLAFYLCKAFVYIPSVQLMFLYYATDVEWARALIIVQIVIVGISFFLDLFITVGIDRYTETYYLYIKKGVFVAYVWSVLFTLFATAAA